MHGITTHTFNSCPSGSTLKQANKRGLAKSSHRLDRFDARPISKHGLGCIDASRLSTPRIAPGRRASFVKRANVSSDYDYLRQGFDWANINSSRSSPVLPLYDLPEYPMLSRDEYGPLRKRFEEFVGVLRQEAQLVAPVTDEDWWRLQQRLYARAAHYVRFSRILGRHDFMRDPGAKPGKHVSHRQDYLRRFDMSLNALTYIGPRAQQNPWLTGNRGPQVRAIRQLAFFRDVALAFNADWFMRETTPTVVVVTHLLPDIFGWLRCLRCSARNLVVIPKGSTRDNARVIDELKATNDYTIRNDLDRERLKDPSVVTRFLTRLAGDGDLLIVDHGGYFAPALASLKKQGIELPIRAVIEHTGNGHERYEEALAHSQFSFPVVSAAKSVLKKIENKEVASAIVDEAAFWMRGRKMNLGAAQLQRQYFLKKTSI